MDNGGQKKYVMINKGNGVRIECTEKYVLQWIARGFEVEEIIQDGTVNITADGNTDNIE